MFNQLCAGNQNQHSEINSLAGKFLLIISQHPVLFIHTNAHSKGKWKNRQMSWEKGVIPMPTSLLISIEQFYTEAGHCNDCPIKPNCCIKCTSSHLKRLWVGGYWPRASHRGNKTPNDTSVKCLHGVGLSSLCSFVHWRFAILLNLLQLHDLLAGESTLHAQCWFPQLQLTTLPISQMQFTISLRLLIISDDWQADSLAENQITAHTNQRHKLLWTLLPFLGSGTFFPFSPGEVGPLPVEMDMIEVHTEWSWNYYACIRLSQYLNLR